MKSILVPIDGSPHAGRALAIACDLARAHGAQLKLFHILLRDRDPGELLRLPAAGRLPEQHTAELKRHHEAPAPELTADQIMAAPESTGKRVGEDHLQAVAKAVLEEAEEQVAAQGIDCQVIALGDGAPAKQIVEVAELAAVDAIVMGCRGLSSIEAFTLGSASQDVCRQAPCPCIMVH
ncbi:MAG: universal stress protein [Pseudomonadota bacterium]